MHRPKQSVALVYFVYSLYINKIREGEKAKWNTSNINNSNDKIIICYNNSNNNNNTNTNNTYVHNFVFNTFQDPLISSEM